MFLLSHIPDGESIVIVQNFDFQILTEIHVLSTPDSKKLLFKKCPADGWPAGWLGGWLPV